MVHICLHTNLYFDFVTHCFDADGVIINITQKCVQDDQIGTTLLSILLLLLACHDVCRVDGGWMVVARYIYRRNHHNNMYAKYELYNLSLDKLAFRKNALRCENFVCCCCCFSGCYYMIRKGRSVPAKLSRCHQCRSVGRLVCVLARIYIWEKTT